MAVTASSAGVIGNANGLNAGPHCFGVPKQRAPPLGLAGHDDQRHAADRDQGIARHDGDLSLA